MLAGTGLTWRQLLNEKRLIPFEGMRSLVLAAKRLTGRPSLGLEWGVSVEAAAHGLTGTAIAASRDLADALQSAAHYRPLRGRALEFDLVQRGDGVTLRELTIVAAGPDMGAVLRLDELGGDADAVGGPADAAFEDIAHAEFSADPAYIDGLAFVHPDRAIRF